MASPYHQSNFETFKREISTLTTNGDGSTTTIVPTSLKSASPTRKSRKNHIDDLRTSRTQNSANRMPNKLPSLQSIPTGKTFVFLFFIVRFDFIEILRFRLESTRSRFDSQTIKPFLPSSTIKLERQLTNINSTNRLPTLYSLFDPDDQKRIANLRRRQVRTIRFNLTFPFDIFVSFRFF